MSLPFSPCAMLGSYTSVGRNPVVDEVMLVGISHVGSDKRNLSAEAAVPPSGNAALPVASTKPFCCVWKMILETGTKSGTSSVGKNVIQLPKKKKK